MSGEKDIQMTSLEMKALDLFGKAPNVGSGPDQISINLKLEKEDIDDGVGEEPHSLQKELQAAVEEAISGSNAGGGTMQSDEEEEEEEEMQQEEPDEEILPENATVNDNPVQSTTTTYRTIVVENANYDDDPSDEHLEFLNHRRSTGSGGTGPTITTISSGGQNIQAPAGTTVTKLINGEMPLKRLRTHAPEHIVYECK